MSLANKNFRTNKREKEWILKFTVGIIEIPKNAVAAAFRKEWNHKNL